MRPPTLASFCQEVNPNGAADGFVRLRQRRRSIVVGFVAESEPRAWVTGRGGEGYLRPNGGVIAEVIEDSARIPGWPGGLAVLGDAQRSADRASVTIHNGTTEPGLAQLTQDRLSEAGYPDGAVETWRSQSVERSFVLYREAGEQAAFDVGRRLGISRVRPVQGNGRDAVGRSPVTVVLGADQMRRINGRITLLDATAGNNRVAARAADRLERRIRFNEALVDAAPGPEQATSRVLSGPRGRALAVRVAEALGVGDVRPKRGDPVAEAAPRDAGDPIVVVGEACVRDNVRTYARQRTA